MSAASPVRPRLLKRPVSDAQREAARRNGARSHGPASDRGKGRSSANARIHGLYAKVHVLTQEDLARFHQRRQAFLNAQPPTDPEEALLLSQLAYADTRIEHLCHLETAIWQDHLNRIPPGPYQIAEAFESMSGSGLLVSLYRLRGRYDRLLDKVAQQLEMSKRTGEVIDSKALEELKRFGLPEHQMMSATS